MAGTDPCGIHGTEYIDFFIEETVGLVEKT